MIKDNIHFTTIESRFDQIELIGTYELSSSLLIKDIMWRQGGKRVADEAKDMISDQLRKVITADMMDVPFLRYLYKDDAMKEIVIEALDRRAFDMRTNIVPKSPKKDYEIVKALEHIIYTLRTNKGIE